MSCYLQQGGVAAKPTGSRRAKVVSVTKAVLEGVLAARCGSS